MSDYDRLWELYVAMVTGYYANPAYHSMNNTEVCVHSLAGAKEAMVIFKTNWASLPEPPKDE